ncbi:hypothetical protein B0A55_08372 [Friedmanniomyces simplex]|uniref:DUF7918 domain-containing protein n=1 Tax=Friedmanniomyces simplex TaxID=329884 RepID=A0A4U0WWD4_9PEZI|nr:hypothetical protein B0A55_08372 [Friedmanniomyces simplex]
MVAIDLLPGIDISIKVAGQALTEHEDHDEEQPDRTATRYIEAVSGQVFEIHITAQKGFRSGGDALSFYIHVDGSKPIDAPLVRNTACIIGTHTHTSQGSRQNAREVKRYRFATLGTASEGQTFADDASKLKDLGSIIITVHQMRLTGATVAAIGSKDLPTVGVVSEKALKGQALSHSVDFTAPVPCKTAEYFTAEPVRGLPNPYATIVFRYRSLETLKSMLIIPRTPTPPPLEERDYDTVNREEFRQLKALKEQKGGADVKIKRERTDENPRPRKVARPTRNSTQLELDDDGGVRESSTPSVVPREIIELD